MPANIVEGDDADAVASYVASVAGLPVSGRREAEAAAQAIAETDGKAIFTAAGCAGCHTLAAAGATGNVGPNLDEAKPSAELVTDRVTNGKGVMPSFKGRLNDAADRRRREVRQRERRPVAGADRSRAT